MIQEYISYFIILLAVAKTLHSLFGFLFLKKKSACSCSSGACESAKLKQSAKEIRVDSSYFKKSA